MDFKPITEAFEGAVNVVSEMEHGAGALVPISREVIERVTDGDDDPRFATFVIESGWSKSNRFWGPELFSDVAAEMNQAAVDGEPIVGYQGHIRPDDDPYSFPEIQLQWVGARLLRSGDQAKLAVKAYVLPGTAARKYLGKGLVKSVSWRGKVAEELYGKGTRIKKFLIESIDLSRPRAAGMSARMQGALTSEMETEGGKNVKPEEIAALQENELRAHNPTLVTSIESAARKPLENTVSEMSTEADKNKPALSLVPEFRKALGLGDEVSDENVLLAAVKSIREAGKQLRDSVLDKVLASKFKDSAKSPDFPLLRRAIVGEMRDKEITLTGNSEADEKMVGEMVDSVIDGDSELKRTVSEMQELPPRVPGANDLNNRDGSRELKPGYQSGNIRVRSASR